MKCQSCQYSDEKQDKQQTPIDVLIGNMPPFGSREFIKIKGQMYVEDYLGDFVEQKTLYACPVCGTVKIAL